MSSGSRRRARAVIAAACLAAVATHGRATAAPPAPSPSHAQEGAAMTTFTKPSDDELRKRLTREQYDVTQHEGTEPPFRNAYWNQHEPGIYVDVVSGEPLFSSLDKFDSGTGWPSFTQLVKSTEIVEKKDSGLGMVRTEVRSKVADSHFGHVFD